MKRNILSMVLATCMFAMLTSGMKCDEGDPFTTDFQVTIRDGETVYSEINPETGVTLSFRATADFTADVRSSVFHFLPVTGQVTPSQLIRSLDVQTGAWINSVAVTGINKIGVFEVDEVEYRGLNLRLRLRSPIRQ